MLDMLIVDDEPIAVNYLVEALQELPHLPLNIIKAYSGKDALAKLGQNKADILLTDIRMPGMNGMELADEVLAKCPRCRVIFLSGYNDFDYIQSALRKGGVDYVLKTEGDAAIIRAIEKAIAEIEAEVTEEHIMQKARRQYHLALPSLRRDYLIEFLQGDVEHTAARRKRFQELDIDLDADCPVLAALVRVDAWGSFSSPADRVLLFYSVHNIAEEYFKSEARFVSFQYDRTRTVWLVQPLAGESPEAAVRALNLCAERIQSACKSLLKVPVSIALSSEPDKWEAVGSRIEALKLQLAFRMGSGEEMLLTEPRREPGPSPRSSHSLMEAGSLRASIHKLDLLEAYLDNGMKDGFIRQYNQLFRLEDAMFAEGEGKWMGLEVFTHLASFFLTYMNKRDLFPALGAEVPADKIYSPDQHAGLREMIAFFMDLGTRISEYNGRRQAEYTNDIIGRVHSYIHQFLHEELSLTKLAELVYLSPPYFSRIYKQLTGQGLIDYINEARIQKAKRLLKTTDKKIHEIATEVGLESAQYFTRLFRKKTGVTPQEYRDSSKGMEAI